MRRPALGRNRLWTPAQVGGIALVFSVALLFSFPPPSIDSPKTIGTAPAAVLGTSTNPLPGGGHPWGPSGAPAWTNVTSKAGVPSLGDAATAWDPNYPGVVLFAGYRGPTSALENSTWLLPKNGTWTNITPAGATPPNRWGVEHQMVYDPNFGGDILYGGCEADTNLLADTWLFKSGNWTDITNGYGGVNYTASPGGLMYGAMAFDPIDNYTLLFGGSPGVPCSSQLTTSSTWTLTPGQGWQQLSPTTSPPALRGVALSYDPAAKEMILFGGRDGSGNCQNETWAFKGGTWTQLSPAHAPPIAYLTGLTYLSDVGYLLEYGGCQSGGCVTGTNQTWMFRGGTWTDLGAYPSFGTSNPGHVGGANMIFDPALNVTIFQGGTYGTGPASDASSDATWEYSWRNLTANLSAAPSLTDVGRPIQFTSSGIGGTFDYSYNYSGLPTNCTAGNVSSFSCSFPSAGTYNLTVNVSDPLNSSANATVSVVIHPPINVSLAASRLLTEPGVAEYLNTSASGGTKAYTYSYAGLPPGCGSANRAALLCHPTTPGRYNVTVSVKDKVGSDSTANLTVIVNSSVAITASWSNTTIDVGMSSTASAAAAGGLPGYAYSWSGLPPGCVNSNSTALNCTPSRSGTFTSTATATDSAGLQASASATIQVNGNPEVTVTGIPAYGYAPLAITPLLALQNGTPPYSVVTSWGDGTPTSSGYAPVHTYTAPGTYHGAVLLRDSFGRAAYHNFTIDVYPALVVSLSANASDVSNSTSVGFVGAVDGGAPPVLVSWQGYPASCPTGVLLTISCTFAVPGHYNISLSATDAEGSRAAHDVEITVYPALRLALGATTNYTSCGRGQVYNFSATPSGGVSPLTLRWNFGDGSGGAQGTLTTHLFPDAGQYTVQATETDSQGHSETLDQSLQVAATPACPGLHPVIPSPSSSSGGPISPIELGGIAAAIAVVAILSFLFVRRHRVSKSTASGEGAEPDRPPESAPEGPGDSDDFPGPGRNP